MALVCAIRNCYINVLLCCGQEFTLVFHYSESLYVCTFLFSSKGCVALSIKSCTYFLSVLFKSRTAVEQIIVLEVFQSLRHRYSFFL